MTDATPTPTPTAVAPGWYNNPATNHTEYWDGTRWAPPPAKAKAAPLAVLAFIVGIVALLFGLIPFLGLILAAGAIVLAIVAIRKKSTPRWMPFVGGGLGVIAGLAAIIAIVALVAGGFRLSTSAPPAAQPSSAAEQPVDKEPVEASEPAETSESAQPALSLGQEQAIKKAESYLAFTFFSRSGLIEQLKFEGFEEADAKFAVDYLEVDWNAQAAGKAEQYMDSMSFSKKSLIEQLKFEGFSQEQAAYGAEAVGF